MNYQEYKSKCRNCKHFAEYSHMSYGECIALGARSSYVPSDNLEYLEYLYDKSHRTV